MRCLSLHDIILPNLSRTNYSSNKNQVVLYFKPAS
jgi:hypothetical protein